MNKKQIIALWVGIFIICGMGLYPPWIIILDHQRLHVRYECPGTYSWLYKAPNRISPFAPEYLGDFQLAMLESVLLSEATKNFATTIRLDLAKLIVQWICVGLFTVGAILTFREQRIK